jgi:putative (di)nucleoside polyphosphate hydrolase
MNPDHLSLRLRANVGIMIINSDKKILAGEAHHYRGEWMMPQGGIDKGEAPIEAMKRELFEETSIIYDQVEFLAEHDDWISYRFRQPLIKEETLYYGQRQKWFLLEYNGELPDPNATQDKEFHQFNWVDFDWLVDNTTRFKVEVYRKVSTSFGRWLEHLI